MPQVGKGTRKNFSHKVQTLPTEFKTGFLRELDGRVQFTKTLKANYDAIVNDVGGKQEVAHIKGALIERFVWLEAVLQTIEQEMATGAIDKSVALGRWIQAVNSLSGLAKVLGIERRSSERPWVEATIEEAKK